MEDKLNSLIELKDTLREERKELAEKIGQGLRTGTNINRFRTQLSVNDERTLAVTKEIEKVIEEINEAKLKALEKAQKEAELAAEEDLNRE